MTFNNRTRCPHCKRKLDAGHRIHLECVEPWQIALKAKEERKKAKEARAAAKVERAETRQRKEALQRIPDLVRIAQVAFNAFIRARDAGKPCICCGRTEGQGYGLSAHGWDAGHYRSTGSASHLRFNEDNVHRQLVVCNRHGAGRAVDYRIGLIQRIGSERVEALEASNAPHKWTREELKEITQTYRRKLKELQQ
jgi:glutaredoxin